MSSSRQEAMNTPLRKWMVIEAFGEGPNSETIITTLNALYELIRDNSLMGAAVMSEQGTGELQGWTSLTPRGILTIIDSDKYLRTAREADFIKFHDLRIRLLRTFVKSLG